MQENIQIYLDFHSTTPVSQVVLDEIIYHNKNNFYNPSASYRGSIHVQSLLENASRRVNQALNTEHHVVFTSGATEANNIAIRCFNNSSQFPILVGVTEHKSVLNTALSMAVSGKKINYLNVNSEGQIDYNQLEVHLKAGVSLVSIMWVNNEIGTVSEILKISKLCQEYNTLFHCDAVQGIDSQNIEVLKNVDLISLSAHKIYGPRGIGALLVSNKAHKLFSTPLFFGGSQQNGMRPGTENVPGILGFVKALECVRSSVDVNNSHRIKLKNIFIEGISRYFDLVENGKIKEKHPGNINLTFTLSNPQRLFSRLDSIAFTTGSACNSAAGQPSHVLTAIGLKPSQIKSTIRMCVGITTKIEEIDAAIDVFKYASSQL